MGLFWQWFLVVTVASLVLFGGTYGILTWLGVSRDVAIVSGILPVLACVLAALPGGVIALMHDMDRRGRS